MARRGLGAVLVVAAAVPAQPEVLKEIYGKLDKTITTYTTATGRAVYGSACFAGFDDNNIDTCSHQSGQLQGPPFENGDMYLAAGAWCLTCCSNSMCNDDDFSSGSGQCKGTVGFNDQWRLHCTMTNPVLTLNLASRNTLTKSQFRFLRNRYLTDAKITHCPLPRMGYKFSPRCLAPSYVAGSPFCPNGFTDDNDLVTCERNAGNHVKCNAGVCTCEIPESYFLHEAVLDGDFYITGYELELEIEARTDGILGTDWRSVNMCRAKSVEQLKSSAIFNDDDGIEFTQYVRMYSKPKSRLFDAISAPTTVAVLLILTYGMFKVLEWVRSTPCSVCFKNMMFCHGRCFWCRLYGAEAPDPTLLAALRARTRNQAPGSVVPLGANPRLSGRPAGPPPPPTSAFANVILRIRSMLGKPPTPGYGAGRRIRVAPAPGR